MKLTYSFDSENTFFGKFKDLLNSLKSFSDIKIGLWV